MVSMSTKYTGEYPADIMGEYRAAIDPLTPAPLLYEIFARDMTDLPYNNGLPLDLFKKVWKALRDNDIADMREFSVSSLFPNRITTSEYIFTMIADQKLLDDEELNSCTKVIEIFDKLVERQARGGEEYNLSSIAITNLLCSPLISVEDFRNRAERHQDILHAHVYSDSRFELKSESIENRELGYVLGAIFNKNIDSDFLVKAAIFLEELGVETSDAYENLNYPIDLSAGYHIENLETYKWSPTYLIDLNARVDKYLTLLSEDNEVWADLPLLWKLKMIA